MDILLGNEPVFEPKKRIYQRLLAGDQEEAAELLDEYLEHQPLVEVYDTVLIPALALAETHWHRGELDEGRHKFILQSLKEIIEDLGRAPAGNAGASGGRGRERGRRRFRIRCLEPTRHRFASSACPLATRRMKSPP